MYEFKFQIPSYYTLLVRSLSVLEGIALASDPKYKVLNAAYPWVARRLLTDQSPELQSTLLSLLYRDGKLNFKRMESLFTEATQSTGLPQRPKGSPSGTPPPRGDAVALILSPQGEFVRGIVVEELAKGADAAWRVAVDSAIFSAYGEIHAAMQNTPGIAQAPMFRNVLDFLSSVPPLSDTDDKEQLEGLWKLANTLQEASIAQSEREKGASTGSSRGSQEKIHASFTASSPLEKLESFVEFAQWAVNETQTLTPEERKQALLLPFEVGQTASTRFIARALRYIYIVTASSTEGKSDGPTEASGASEASDKNPKRPSYTTTAVSSSMKGPIYVQKRFLFKQGLQNKSSGLSQAGRAGFHPTIFGDTSISSGAYFR